MLEDGTGLGYCLHQCHQELPDQYPSLHCGYNHLLSQKDGLTLFHEENYQSAKKKAGSSPKSGIKVQITNLQRKVPICEKSGVKVQKSAVKVQITNL